MKNPTVVLALLLAGCNSVPPWMAGPEVGEPACTAQCNAHFEQCPQVFAGFPERGAVECPAEHNNCLRSCANRRPAARTAATPWVASPTQLPASPAAPSATPPQVMTNTVGAVSSKEARLRELKHLYDEGLLSDDVYRERQKEIVSEP